MNIEEHAHKFPADMKGFFYARWDKRQIWQLDLGVFSTSVSSLAWHLDLPFWSTRPPAALCDLAPNQVLDNMAVNEIHQQRILNVDIDIPLDMAIFGERLIILDGLHRLAYARLSGLDQVRYRVVPKALFLPKHSNFLDK